MKGETKLSRRKSAQRAETSRFSFWFLCALFSISLVLIGRAYIYKVDIFPGLRMVAPANPELETKRVEAVDTVGNIINDQILSNSSTNVVSTVPAASRIASGSVEDIVKSSFRGTQVSKRPRIAFAITINKDGSFQDGAAVLAYSIISSFSGNNDYDISLIAFVHPNVTTSRPVLKKIGYHVIEVPTPINTSAIKFEFLREKIDKNGCCGATELIKLNSFRLLQYERVVHLDADTIIVNPIDNLFRYPYSLIYTTDPNMATYKAPECMPVQGGFIVLKPNVDDYKNLINIMLTTEFRKGKGWNSSKIGWFWGGMTVQGVLPYYYNKITTPGRSLVLDRCIYNTMADTENCTMQTLEEIRSAHFTVCQKPWMCYRAFVNDLCGKLHKHWFRLRSLAEVFFGLDPVEAPCPKGHGSYVHMNLGQARIPSVSNLVRDDSPDFLAPIGNTGYISDKYH